MPPTGLLFYRTPKDLHQLKTERPRNIQEVHNAVTQAVKIVERRLADLEFTFFEGRGLEADVTRVSMYVRQMLVQYQLVYVHSSQHVQTMLKYCRAEDHPFYEEEGIDAFADYDRKICEYLPDKFLPLLEDLQIAIDCLDKYNQSFYEGEYGGMLLAPFTYEAQREQFKKIAQESTAKIHDMAHKYKNDKLLADLKFDLGVQIMARKLDLGEMLLFQLIPEAVHNILIICEQIRKWLLVDQRYAADVQNDMQNFKDRITSEKVKVSFYLKKGAILASKIKYKESQIGILKTEVTKLNRREDGVDKDIGDVEKRMKAVETDIRFIRRERNKLLERSKTDSSINLQRNTDLASNLQTFQKLTNQLIPIEEELDDVTGKKNYITKKQNDVTQQYQEISMMKQKLGKYKKKLDECQSRMFTLECCFEKLREIYVFRTSYDMVKRLHTGEPLKLKLGRSKSDIGYSIKAKQEPKLDKLSLAIKKASRGLHSDADWQILYLSMPFVPPRDLSMLEGDIEKIMLAHPITTATPHTRARNAFNIWRMVHAEACLDIFQNVLCDNNRRDLVLEINDAITAAETKDKAPKSKKKLTLNQTELNWREMRDSELAAIKYSKTHGPERHYQQLPLLSVK